MLSPKSYDEAMSRAEEIVQRLEKTEALSVSEYKEQAEEVKRLLDFAESCLRDMDYSAK